MFKKFIEKILSRKFIVTVGTGVIDILIAISVIPAEHKPVAMVIVTGLASLYVLVQGVIDGIEKAKQK
jgi:hypothetical protein